MLYHIFSLCVISFNRHTGPIWRSLSFSKSDSWKRYPRFCKMVFYGETKVVYLATSLFHVDMDSVGTTTSRKGADRSCGRPAWWEERNWVWRRRGAAAGRRGGSNTDGPARGWGWGWGRASFLRLDRSATPPLAPHPAPAPYRLLTAVWDGGW
jgi:hypothetical protein